MQDYSGISKTADIALKFTVNPKFTVYCSMISDSVCSRKVIKNDGSQTHTMNVRVLETVMETMLFSQPAGVSAETTFTASVPFITTGALSSPYTYSYGKCDCTFIEW